MNQSCAYHPIKLLISGIVILTSFWPQAGRAQVQISASLCPDLLETDWQYILHIFRRRDQEPPRTSRVTDRAPCFPSHPGILQPSSPALGSQPFVCPSDDPELSCLLLPNALTVPSATPPGSSSSIPRQATSSGPPSNPSLSTWSAAVPQSPASNLPSSTNPPTHPVASPLPARLITPPPSQVATEQSSRPVPVITPPTPATPQLPTSPSQVVGNNLPRAIPAVTSPGASVITPTIPNPASQANGNGTAMPNVQITPSTVPPVPVAPVEPTVANPAPVATSVPPPTMAAPPASAITVPPIGAPPIGAPPPSPFSTVPTMSCPPPPFPTPPVNASAITNDLITRSLLFKLKYPNCPVYSQPNQSFHSTLPTSQNPWDRVWQQIVYRREQEKPRITRGLICPIIPQFVNQRVIWRDRPIFVWKGKAEKISVADYIHDRPIWTQDRMEGFNSVVFVGDPLKPGTRYIWKAETGTKTAQVIFQTLEQSRSREINAKLMHLDKQMRQKKVTSEEQLRQRVQFFLNQNLFLDAIQELYTLPNPSLELKVLQNQLVQVSCPD